MCCPCLTDIGTLCGAVKSLQSPCRPCLLHHILKNPLSGECRTIKHGQYLLLCSKRLAILSSFSNAREISQAGPFLSLVLRRAEGPEARRQTEKCFASDCTAVAFFRNQLGGVSFGHIACSLWGLACAWESHCRSMAGMHPAHGLPVTSRALHEAWKITMPVYNCSRSPWVSKCSVALNNVFLVPITGNWTEHYLRSLESWICNYADHECVCGQKFINTHKW